MNNKTSSANLLKILSEFVQTLSDKEYNLLLNHKAYIKLINQSSSNTKQTPVEKDFSSFIKTLTLCQSRNEAQDLFNNNKFTKKDLTVIAKNLGIHILSKDRKDIIISKLIEGTVGVKLKSKAIESLDLSSKTMPF